MAEPVVTEEQPNLNRTSKEAAQFLGNFWGPDERGFFELLNRMKVAKHTCVELLTVVAGRIEMEEEYAKKLVKLAKTPALGKDEEGTLRKALDTFKLEMEQHAKSRTTLADELRKKLQVPMDQLMNKHRDLRKQHQTALEKTIKSKQAVESNLQKLEEKYRQKQQESKDLQELQRSARPGKESDKILNKISKNIQSMQQLEREYDDLSNRYRDVHSTWVKEMTGACIDFQRLEEERLDFTRKWLWDYTNLGSTSCVADDDSFERIRTGLESCDVQFDIREFIAKHATGTSLPPLPDRKTLTGESGALARQPRASLSMRPGNNLEESGVAPAVVTSAVTSSMSVAGAQSNVPSNVDSVSTTATPMPQHELPVLKPAVNPFFDDMMNETSVSPPPPLTSAPSNSGIKKSTSQKDLSFFANPPTIPNVGVHNQTSFFENTNPFSSDMKSQNNEKFEVRVTQNYDAEDNEELTVDVGQTLRVLGQPKAGYYLGELQIGKHKCVGLVPMAVVERAQ